MRRNLTAIGNTQGVIRLFNSEGNELKPLTANNLKDQEVTCVDIHPSENYIVSGTNKGWITLWDYQKMSLIKSFATNNGVMILSAKFLKSEKLLVVWSDVKGEIVRTEVVKFMMMYNINHTVVMKGMYGFGLHPLISNKFYRTKFDKLNVVAIAGIDSVIILNIKEESELLWGYDKSTFCKDAVPYVAWGRGALPGDLNNTCLVLAIAWGQVIQLIQIEETSPKEKYTFRGYYESGAEIIGVEWVNEGVLVIIDTKGEAKLLYTGDFEPGNYAEQVDGKIMSPLEQPYHLNAELVVQVVNQLNNEETKRHIYYQSICCQKHSVICLTSEGLVEGRLYEWNEFLDQQGNKENWIHILNTSIQLYSGKLKGFAELPEAQDFREETLKGYMKNYLLKSLNDNLEKQKESGNETEQAQISIEYCIIIKAYDLLFKDLFSVFNDHESKNAFLKAIKPFILKGELRTVPIIQRLFDEMVKYYSECESPEVFEQIFLLLCLEGQDLNLLNEICAKNKLYSTFIYSKTIEDDEKGFKKPLVWMYKESYIKYKRSCITSVGYKMDVESALSKPEIHEKSESYLKFKIMWYIDLCFKGKKYPLIDKRIASELWPKVIYTILDWLFSQDEDTCPIEELLYHDIKTTLNIFYGLYANEDTRTFIKSKESLSNQILKQIKDSVENIGKESTKIEFANFLVQIASIEGIVINNEICNDTIKVLASIGKNYSTKEVIEDSIITLLSNRKETINKSDIESLLVFFEIKEYDRVQIKLLEMNKEYNKCFKVFLSTSDEITKEKVFDWLTKVSKNLDEEEKEELTANVLNGLEQLLSIDMEKTKGLIDELFNHRHEKVIEKLGSKPELQLAYSLKILNDKENDIKRTLDGYYMSYNETEEYKRYNMIILLSVKLMCDHAPDQLMPYIKKEWYPAEQCLEICKAKDHKEATAYLLERFGSFEEALKLYLSIFNQLDKDIKKNESEEEINKTIAMFSKIFNNSLEVCCKNAKMAENSEDEQELWFTFLDKLYNMRHSLQKLLKKTISIKDHKKVSRLNLVLNVLNDSMSTLLREMKEYVPLPSILDRITKYEELTISTFKGVFSSMLTTCFYQEGVLESAKNIMAIGASQEFIQLNKYLSQGAYLKHTYCAKCTKHIIYDTQIEATAFPCGHIYHIKCLKDLNDCYVCVYWEKSILL